MKFNTSILLSSLFLILTLFSSCDKGSEGSENCVEIEYNQTFIAEEGERYCTPDGNEIYVKSLINEFCPCSWVCVWEGEVQATLELIIDGEEIEYNYHGAHLVNPNEALPLDLEFHHHEIEFESECTQTNPSPAIKTLELELRN